MVSQTVGDVETYTTTVTDDVIKEYASVTGDTNPLHLEDSYASETIFGERIAHGMLAMGFVSAALAKFDGVVIYVGQNVEFENPIPIGATVTAEVRIVEEQADGTYRVETDVVNEDDGTVYLEGVASIRIHEEPE